MSDENKKPEDQATEQSADAAAEQAEAAAAEIDPVEVLATENADLKDRALRAMAEMENLRRRTEKEVKDARQYAVSSFARDMLTVSDNLRRALDALPEDDRKNADAGIASLIEGVEMIERDLLNQLEKNGVKKLNPEGQKFDPNFHQAMFEVPNTEVPNNTVVQVVQAGYVIGERVLRPAMVGVSKGGPKDVAQAPSDAAGEAGQTIDKSA
ncbi:MAG: nucleotide exchange factor GrpE [Roseibium sp.]|uniref:nucleotide exchange factor GrpE n=1 Tax=Roseibium sp. TaxID=1936156 RepID=UPI001B254D8A|nr:nucleotide exchange factor GrpE [Roseibium sp.]MBO6891727.1 nucleotide exchange factor GrpE [Roseibium sp.]MBO6930572.1 nucleotide exchange factor GrpE [Roseibium sp.]